MPRLFILFTALLCATCAAQDAREIQYRITFADPLQHKLHLQMKFPAHPAGDLQLPVWNATYQVRDFSQYVSDVRSSGVVLRKVNSSRWHVGKADGQVTVDYDYVADMPGPFGATYDSDHAFLNFAMLLMYPVEQRSSPIRVEIANAPRDWRIATALPAIGGASEGHARFAMHARDYDHLVDSPVELGKFDSMEFPLRDSKIKVVIHSQPGDYDREKIKASLEKITAAATEWMSDTPFSEFLFILHFPRSPTRGGMEHAYSTAINTNADRLKNDYSSFEGTSAHEFFHLWNVKRIRPQSMEPVDFTREQPSTALWFSEGVTSTAGNFIRLRAGLEGEQQFFRHLEEAISELQLRPAHTFQSAEQSSMETWLDKYPFYRLPERSINYYNKGEILGYLLDLRIREVTGGNKSLRDVFLLMNDRYARAGKFFPDSAGVQQAIEKVTNTSFADFFSKYVSGTYEIPYDEFFRAVGLRLLRAEVTTPEAGFDAVVNFQGPPVVNRVDESAESSGIQIGDAVLAINGKGLSSDLAAALLGLKPGQEIELRLRAPDASERLAKLRLRSKTEEHFHLADLPQISPTQRELRARWLSGDRCSANCANGSLH